MAAQDEEARIAQAAQLREAEARRGEEERRLEQLQAELAAKQAAREAEAEAAAKQRAEQELLLNSKKGARAKLAFGFKKK